MESFWEKVAVFIEILAGGTEPGVFSAAPERRNLQIEVDVGMTLLALFGCGNPTAFGAVY